MENQTPKVTTRASVVQGSPDPIVIPNGKQEVKIVSQKRPKVKK